MENTSVTLKRQTSVVRFERRYKRAFMDPRQADPYGTLDVAT